MSRASQLRDLNDEELAHHLAEMREELFTLRFQLAVGKQDNSARIGHVRREVARALTLQHERREGHNPLTATPAAVKPARRKAAN
jgi:large subunit ribosomal protein L29